MLRALLAAALLTRSAVSGAQGVPAAPSAGDSDRRVEALLAQLTLEEKIGLIAGRTGFHIPGLLSSRLRAR